jgi:hypothetical protein
MTSLRLKARTTGLSWRELDDQIVLLDLESSSYLAISGAGTVIWHALIDGSTLDELIEQVCVEFDIDAATARTDVSDFLADLGSRGLLA